MPTEKDKTLKYSQGQKSLRAPVAYYCDIECLNIKIDICRNNPEQSFTTKVSKHEPCGFSIAKKSPLTDIRKKILVIEVKIAWKNVAKSLKNE